MKWDIFRRTGAIWIAAVLGLLLAGCGGGGESDNESGAAPTPPTQSLAPGSLSGHILTLNGADGYLRQLSFTSESVWMENRAGTITSGSYEYSPSGSTANLLLIGNGSNASLTMVFGSANAGTYSFTNGDGSQGTFTLQTSQSNPDPGNPGGDPAQGLAPTSISGRTMYGTRTFTSTGPVGQTHVYTFSANGFHDSDPPEESDGVFNYAPDGNRATLTLAYYAPEDFNGDRHDIQMVFRTEESGSFESIYTRRDGTVIRINGNFELQ